MTLLRDVSKWHAFEGSLVMLCDHVALNKVPGTYFRQTRPLRGMGADGRPLKVNIALLCAVCAKNPPEAGEGMFLAVMKDGKAVPAPKDARR